jgi:hypothetical protein
MELVAGSDRRTENLLTSNEIAGIIPYEHSATSFRDIRIYLRANYFEIKDSYSKY